MECSEKTANARRRRVPGVRSQRATAAGSCRAHRRGVRKGQRTDASHTRGFLKPAHGTGRTRNGQTAFPGGPASVTGKTRSIHPSLSNALAFAVQGTGLVGVKAAGGRRRWPARGILRGAPGAERARWRVTARRSPRLLAGRRRLPRRAVRCRALTLSRESAAERGRAREEIIIIVLPGRGRRSGGPRFAAVV